MTFSDLFFGTLRALWDHKLRTGLSMFGIAWGIVSITLMVAAGEGLRVGQEEVSANFGKNLMIVFSGRTSMQAGGARAGRRIHFQYGDHAAVQAESPSCEHVLPELGRGDSPIKSLYNNASLNVVGSLPDFSEVRAITVDSGRFYNRGDVAAARRVAFLGSDARKQLFADRNPLGETILIRGIPYTVVGTMLPKEQDSSYDGRDVYKIYIPITALMKDFPSPPPALPDQIDRLLVAPPSLEQHERCKLELRRALARIHDFDPRDEEAANIWDTVENMKQFRTMTDGMKYFLGAIGVVTLFLGGIGVMNVMLVTVKERTREIGIRKAVGATSRSILWQFFIETLIVVLLSGGVGLSLAFGICAAVNTLPMPQFFAGLIPSLGSSLLTFGLLGSVGILSALYPASRAAHVDPVQALYYEAGG